MPLLPPPPPTPPPPPPPAPQTNPTKQQATDAAVLRGGRLQRVPASDLVPGDIVEVAVGGQIPADLRVISLLTATLRADQSILTGESRSVAKDARAVKIAKAVYQDKTNMLYSVRSEI